MSTKKLITKSAQETKEYAREFAQQILQQSLENYAVVLALKGDLGAGKTTFLQGFAEGLGIKEVVNSPTFVVMKRFEIKNAQFKNFYHFDCYRIETPEDILHLGFKEIIENPENIVGIEWPEKIESYLPTKLISIIFIHNHSTQRSLKIEL